MRRLLLVLALFAFTLPLSADVVGKAQTSATLKECKASRKGRIVVVDNGVGESPYQVVCKDTTGNGDWEWVTVGGTGDVLLAGDADGQTIQGVTGSDRPRLAMDGEGASLYGVGAAPSSLQILEGEAFLSSGDAESYVDIADGYVSVVSNGYIEVIANELKIISSQTPPTNANDTCTAGDTIDTATFHYYCHATNSWVRAVMAAW